MNFRKCLVAISVIALTIGVLSAAGLGEADQGICNKTIKAVGQVRDLAVRGNDVIYIIEDTKTGQLGFRAVTLVDVPKEVRELLHEAFGPGEGLTWRFDTGNALRLTRAGKLDELLYFNGSSNSWIALTPMAAASTGCGAASLSATPALAQKLTAIRMEAASIGETAVVERCGRKCLFGTTPSSSFQPGTAAAASCECGFLCEGLIVFVCCF